MLAWRRLIGGTVLLAAAIPAASCGSSSTGSSKSPFTSRADAACQTRGQAVATDNQIAVRSSGDAAAYAGDIASAWQQEVSSLHKLTAPAAAKNSFAAFVSGERSIADFAGAAQKAAKSNNAQVYDANARAVLITQQKDLSKAAAAGLSTCAQKLPTSDQQSLKSLAVAGAVHPKASLCTASATKYYINAYWQGSVSKCETGLVKSRATSATATDIFGIVPGAWVYLTQTGVSPSHSKVLLFFVRQNGAWKIDSVQAQP